MNGDDPAVLAILRRCMVARIATLSRTGRPSITPLYFVCVSGRIWLGTSDWTRASRNVQADPRVSVLFEVEQDPGPRRVLRISGRASVRTDLKGQRSYNRRVARKYVPFARWHPPLSGPPAATQAPGSLSRSICRERPGLRHRGHPSSCRVALGFAVRLLSTPSEVVNGQRSPGCGSTPGDAGLRLFPLSIHPGQPARNSVREEYA